MESCESNTWPARLRIDEPLLRLPDEVTCVSSGPLTIKLSGRAQAHPARSRRANTGVSRPTPETVRHPINLLRRVNPRNAANNPFRATCLDRIYPDNCEIG